MDIKNTMECLVAAEKMADGVLAACADKKLSILDLRHALEPARAAADAIKDIKLVAAELKDADPAEVEALLTKLTVVAPKVIDAGAALASVVGA